MTFRYIVDNGAMSVEGGSFVSQVWDLIDSFEDGGLGEWTQKDGDFETANVGSTTARKGDWIVQFSTGGGVGDDDSIISTDGSGLPRYPSEGDTTSCFILPETDNQIARYYVGVQEDRNKFPHGYFLEADGENNQIRLRHENPADTSTNETIDSASADLTGWANQWNEFWIDWGSGGSWTAEVRDNNGNVFGRQLTGSNSHDSSGGVALSGETREESDSDWDIRYDWLRMR